MNESEEQLMRFLAENNKSTADYKTEQIVRLILLLDTVNAQIAYAAQFSKHNTTLAVDSLTNIDLYGFGRAVDSAVMALQDKDLALANGFASDLAQMVKENTRGEIGPDPGEEDMKWEKDKDGNDLCPLFHCKVGECDLCKAEAAAMERTLKANGTIYGSVTITRMGITDDPPVSEREQEL
jgi:hypothetical protein